MKVRGKCQMPKMGTKIRSGKMSQRKKEGHRKKLWSGKAWLLE
jgi:hypothetical protein